MKEHIALIEPNYYTKFPPIGLLKLSALEKQQRNTTELIRKLGIPKKRPNRIYVTSLFTWAWKPVWQAVRKYKSLYPEAELILGGLYASILPDHAKLAGPNRIHVGVLEEAEELLPDYSLVPEWNGSIIHASRGCNKKCIFCAVPYIEGKLHSEKKSIKKYIWPTHTKLIFFDNNILDSKYWYNVFEEIIELKMEVDFNQGLDARLMSEEAADMIMKMNIPVIRFAYDTSSYKKYVETAINLLKERGTSGRNLFVYTLYNFTESPDEFFNRVREILEWDAVCYPMQYQPCESLKKNSYISKFWTKKKLNMVAKARRVIGYGGAFPPYDALVDKFKKDKNFMEGFGLHPIKKN